MLDPVIINAAVEGVIDEIVIRRLCDWVGLPFPTMHGRQGKQYILDHLPSNYNKSAQYAPWLVVIDLDHDANCAPDYVKAVLPTPAQWMRLRIVVRAVESWLMADGERFSAFMQIPATQVPAQPDAEEDPKRTLVNLVRQFSVRQKIREAIVPKPGSGRSVGPGYTARMIEFVGGSDNVWRPEVALEHSDSLRRCVAALRTLKDWKPAD